MTYNLFSIDYKIEYGRPVLYLFCRDRYGRRKVLKEENFKPHFFVPHSDVPHLPPHPVRAIDGTVVAKIETKFPRDVPIESEKYTRAYENNILFPLVFLIEKSIYCGVTDDLKPAPELDVKPRVMYIDTEVSVEDDSILVISYLDSYTRTLFSISRKDYPEEELLLMEFINHVRHIDPDIITAWNVHFDLIEFIKRCKLHGINYHNLSPLKYVQVRKTHGKYGEREEVKISGRTVFDLWDAYRKFFQGKTFDSDKLEERVEADLGIKKVNFDYTNKCNINYIDEVIKLNRHHVDIEYMLDQHWGLINTFETMRRTIGCLLNQCLVTNQYGDVLILRECKGKYILPGKREVADKPDYAGAYVHQPPKGVFENVAVLDIAAMYPSLIRAFNLSPETLIMPEKFGETPDVPHFKVGRYYYRRKPIGIYPRIIEKLQKVRAEVKRKMKEEKDKQKYKVLWARQYALKQAIAALYGLTALPAFRLYKPEVASSITSAGRQLVKSLIQRAKGLGYEVYYSDTDSIHAKVKSHEDGERLANLLNDFLYKTYVEELGCHLAPELEYEKLYRKVLYVGVKKRYVGLVDGEIEYKGFEIKKSSSAQITRDLQKAIFNRILVEGNTESIKDLIRQIKDDLPKYPLEYLAIPQALNKSLDKYDKPAQRKAVIATEQKMGVKFKVGEKPKKIPVKWIGEDPGIIEIRGKKYIIDEMVLVNGKLPSGAIPDYDRIFEKSVWKPVERILDAIGLDYDVVFKHKKQTSLFDFEPKVFK